MLPIHRGDHRVQKLNASLHILIGSLDNSECVICIAPVFYCKSESMDAASTDVPKYVSERRSNELANGERLLLLGQYDTCSKIKSDVLCE